MRWFAATATGFVLTALAACSGGVSAGTPPAAPQPACSSIFADEHVLTKSEFDAGCMDGAKHRILTSFNCKDGRQLYGKDGAWAFIGDTVHVVPSVADDPGYKAAFTACTA